MLKSKFVKLKGILQMACPCLTILKIEHKKVEVFLSFQSYLLFNRFSSKQIQKQISIYL